MALEVEPTYIPKVEKAPDWTPTNRAVLVDGERKVIGPGEIFRVRLPGARPDRYFYPREV